MTVDWSRQRVLIVAPHPDDELIGCGALIRRIKREGGEVHVLYMTVADTADFSSTGISTEEERLAEIDRSARFIGIDSYDVALPGWQNHLRLDTIPRQQLVAIFERRDSQLSITGLRPTAIIFTDATSYNQDHQAVARAAVTALRPGPDEFRHQPSLVLTYEEVADGWSGDQVPGRNFFAGVEPDDVDQKIAALRLQASQWREHPHTRSEQALRGLALVRGAQCGLPCAEAFRCLRWRG